MTLPPQAGNNPQVLDGLVRTRSAFGSLWPAREIELDSIEGSFTAWGFLVGYGRGHYTGFRKGKDEMVDTITAAKSAATETTATPADTVETGTVAT